jgi:hypothetical protein
VAYIDTTNMPLHMPVPGSREPAQIALLNENCVVLDTHDHTDGKGLAIGRLRSGLEANRPAAGSPGYVYFATDTGRFYVDTGSAWVQFLTEGGQGTVTGWTLIDPIVRDTLQFGPEGGSAIDATLTRVAAGSLQTDSKFGVGVTPDPQWGPNLRIVQFGSAGALVGYSGTDAEEVQLTGNTVGRVDAKQYAMIPNSPANRLRLSQGAFHFEMAPSAAAGAVQTFATHMLLDAAGNLGVAAAPSAFAGSYRGLQLGTGMTLWSYFQGAVNAMIGVNNWYDGTNHRAIIAGAGANINMNSTGNFVFHNIPAVAAGGVQTPVARFTIAPNGTVTMNPDNGALVIGGGGANARVHCTTGNIELNAVGGIIYPVPDSAIALGWNTNRWSNVYASGVHGGPGNLYLRGAGSGISAFSSPYFMPETDAGQNLGYPSSGRWANLYIYYAPTVGSHADMKENFAPLDPTACVQAVLNTDWISYDYKQQPPPPRREDEEDEAYQARLDEHQKMLADTDFSRHQKGYALGHPEYKVADMFGTSDRANRSDGADLGVVACALQDALRRLAALEGKSGDAAAA